MNDAPEEKSEGLDPATEGSAESPAPSVATPRLITIGLSQPLGAEDSVTLARRGRAKVVVLAGPADSGKTTLLTCLYDRFQMGQFAGFIFRSSYTLPSFERRVFFSRIESGRSVPDTERTRGGHGPQFLHLELLSSESGRSIDLLFSDLAGETFERVRDNSDEWASLPFIRRADRLLVILDGARFVSDEARHAAHYSARQLARSAAEAAVLPAERIDVLVTKWDKVVAVGDEAIKSVETATSDILDVIAAAREGRVFRTSARVELQGEIEEGYGLDDLLRSLAIEERLEDALEVGRFIPQSQRYFHRFNGRRE
jgi:hypothetical protein